MADPSLVLDLVGKASGIIRKGLKYKGTVQNLESLMEELVPVVEEIKQSSETMNLDAREMETLTAMMETTQEIIRKCSKVDWWCCCLLPCYQSELDEADKSLVRFISVQVQMQMLRDLRLIRLELNLKLTSEEEEAANLSPDLTFRSQSSMKYEVFISFRVEDTRRNFASYLYAALCSEGIKTYSDYRLEKGEDVWPSVEKVIENSTIFLVILSKNYASSSWCLKELTKILECSKGQGHLVVPVFYEIDPADVRRQIGSYQDALANPEHNYQHEQVRKWRAALTEATSFSGWVRGAFRDDSDLIQEIVSAVEQRITRYRS